jgi:hypothetical protein
MPVTWPAVGPTDGVLALIGDGDDLGIGYPSVHHPDLVLVPPERLDVSAPRS